MERHSKSSSAVYQKNPNVPVITERLLKWVLGTPHHESLEALWRTTRNRSYFPVRGLHYSDHDFDVDFSSVGFRSLDLGLTLLNPWTPEKDIHIA